MCGTWYLDILKDYSNKNNNRITKAFIKFTVGLLKKQVVLELFYRYQIDGHALVYQLLIVSTETF